MLAPDTDDMPNCDFQWDLNIVETKRSYRLQATFGLKAPGLEALIQSGKASFGLHIECPRSRYRDLKASYSPKIEVIIDASDLEGEVELCAFVLATQDMQCYQSRDFHPDYEGTIFEVAKGDILAVAVEKTFSANKDVDSLRNLPSVFTIQPNSSPDAPPISYTLGQDKIVILMQKSIFDHFRTLQVGQEMPGVLSSLVVTPVLVSILEHLKLHADDARQYKDYRWYRALSARFTNLGITSLDAYEPIELAQSAVGGPLAKALSELVEQAMEDSPTHREG